MTRLLRHSGWAVSLAILYVLAGAIVATRAAQAQDASLLVPRPGLGLARAVVVDLQDPSAAGRIKVKFPWLPRDVEEWAHVSLPLGGNRTGLWALPEIGDEVIVGFEHGDVRSPIVLGSLWNGQRPPTSGH
jgi:uncharacterized protein involved in type VI secretion and phage assembly